MEMQNLQVSTTGQLCSHLLQHSALDNHSQKAVITMKRRSHRRRPPPPACPPCPPLFFFVFLLFLLLLTAASVCCHLRVPPGIVPMCDACDYLITLKRALGCTSLALFLVFCLASCVKSCCCSLESLGPLAPLRTNFS